MHKIFFYLILLVSFALDSSAQEIRLIAADNNPVLLNRSEQDGLSKSNIVCSTDTLQLPFFDDFSSNEDVYPSCSHWQDDHVYVNKSMAAQPPSIGVATFDGLNSIGMPYNMNVSVSSNEPADTLTSQCIDLSSKGIGDDIFLSFYIQAQGLSDRPELQDSFFLEFRDTAGIWNRAWSVNGVDDSVSSLTILPFQLVYVPLIDSAYFYDAFQFRFRNLASITGNNDHWHLDYVFLDENRATNADTNNANYGRFPDVAFTSTPSTPLKNGLTAMPFKHFNDSCWANEVLIQNYNHNDFSGVATLDRIYSIDELEPNASNLLTEAIPAVPSYLPSPNINDSLGHSINNVFPSGITLTEKTILESTLTITSAGGFQSNPIFFNNDTVSRITALDNYFAYDDGTAETRVIAQGIGTKIAVEFTAEVADTLQGIYFHMPYFRNRDSELDFINVKVWLDSLNTTEVFSLDLHKLEYSYGFNGFHLVEMLDFSGNEILIFLQPGQKFYIGWQQASTIEVPIGFDRSSDARDKTFVGVGTNWVPMTEKGAVMIRPLLWGNNDFTVIPVQQLDEPESHIKLFPNPVDDYLMINGISAMNQELTYRIIDVQGRMLMEEKLYESNDLTALNNGIYFMVILSEDGKIFHREKFIKK